MELAVVRPDEWNFALLLHLLGAMVLVGVLVLVVCALVGAWRGGTRETLRLGLLGLLWGALPSYIVMRVSAQWIADKEGFKGDDDPTWIGIGYMTSETSFLLLVIATFMTWFAVRKARSVEAEGGGTVKVRAATVLVGIALALYVVAIWAMTTKPV